MSRGEHLHVLPVPLGEAPAHIRLVEHEADVERLEVDDPARVAYLTQTTLSLDDTRRLIAMTGFSIEPGIYLAGEFGVRSEVNIALNGANPNGLFVQTRNTAGTLTDSEFMVSISC